MLQPRILVGSHRTDQQTTKFNNCVAINRRNCKNTSKMWSQHFTKSTSTNLNGCGINIKRRQTTAKNIKSTAAATAAARRFTSTRALNISSSLHNLATFLILAITLYSTTICMAQLSEHNKDLQPTPSLDSEKADVTTILLVDNNNRAAHGRFLNVKPAVGLLTSTARTFIQDGVTTEYATQVLGKTIDNGRLYAQLLTKSSRVVYSNNANNNDIDATVTVATVTPANAYNQIIPTQVIGPAIKYADNTLTIGNSDVKNKSNNKNQMTINLTKNDDDNVVTFIKNTDYISPNNPSKAYNVHTVAVNSVNFGSGEDIAFELLPQSLAQVRIPIEEKAEVRQSFSVSESSSSSSNGGGSGKNAEYKIQLSPERVRTSIELPTFTVPSGYTFEDIDSGFYGSLENAADNSEEISQEIQQNRIGKQLTSIQIPIAGFTEEEKQLQSVTYYGFADFTTVVGNTVIVFSPNTAPPSIGKVTSIKGEATLRSRIEPTQTVEQNQVIAQTKLLALNSIEEYNRKSKAETTTTKTTTTTTTTTSTTEQTTTTTESQEVDEILTQKVSSTDSSTETAEEQSAEELEQKSSILAKEQNSLKYNLSPSVIEASEIQTQTEELAKTPTIQIVAATTASKAPMLSIPSDEDIAKIFASLAAKDKTDETVSKDTIREQTAETLTGATTIFFEDDPFQLFASAEKEADIKPSATVVTATTESIEVTTENDGNVLTTTENVAEENTSEPVHSAESEETDDEKPETTTDSAEEYGEDLECEKGYILQHTTVYKTLSYLTTFFIPDDNDEKSTSTHIESNDVVRTDILMTCTLKAEAIKPTAVEHVELKTKSVEPIKISLKERNRYLNRVKDTTTPPPTTTEEPTTENSSESEIDENGSNVATTENVEGNTIEAVTLSVSSSTTTESTNDSEEDEIELIYKTLFTTYTYLTTFFHGYTSSVSSRKEVVTNIVTSTLDMSLIKSDAALADLVASMSDKTERIEPTKVANDVGATRTHARKKEQAISIEDIFDDSYVESNLNQATPILSDAAIEASQIEGSLKTFYTTYTYYTTIFADGETEIASRTEVYTNFVGPSVKPTSLVEEDKIFSSKIIEKVNEKLNEVEDQRKDEESTESSTEEDLDNHVIQPSYTTMVRSAERSAQSDALTTTQANDDGDQVTTTESTNNKVEKRTSAKVKKSQKDSDYVGDEEAAEESTISVNKFNSTFKTIKLPDTKRVVESIRKQLNNILEDQISSESQNEEILPSSTLLLQTSYTTFTYFTTQYVGDASEVLSRLETITNVVTETLQPTQTIVIPPAALADEPILPTTYFTTFTYWTTLFKEGEVVTLSNTKVISNVVAPTASTLAIDEIFPTARVKPVNAVAPSIVVASPSTVEASTEDNAETENDTQKPAAENVIEASIVSPTQVLEPTTYFTTYTYYTTSYVGDDTVLNSRFETVTNVITPSLEPVAMVATVTPAGRAINLDNVKLNQIIDGKGEKKFTKDKLTEKSKEPSVVSLNVGKIVDAEGISTIFYTTKAIGTYINNAYSQITEKTSSVNVDESKKSSILEATPNYADNKHKTGLVRLIDGKIVANHTTTLYQSKVIGTIIDNRYAQIIESTSSYIIDKTQEASIAPTATSTAIKPTEAVISPTSAVVESSLSDSHSDHEGDDNEEHDEHDEDETDENGRKKSRLTFTTKKPKFTPIIRPFVSRNRPTFAPKRKNLLASSATIITQSDFTPTIRATPAIGKAETSTRRFSGGSRRASNAPYQANASSATATPALASGSKRFSRLRTSSTGPSGPSSILPSASGSARVIRPSSVRPTQSSGLIGSSRRVGNLFRSSSLNGNRLSILPSSVRFRANPTVTPSLRDSTTTKAPELDDGITEAIETNPDENENNDENKEEDEAISTTTENARRNQNPLLRFRRPLTSAGAGSRFQPTSTARPNPVSVSTRRTPLLQRSRSTQATTTTSTTSKPKQRSFQKPASLAALTNRPRTSSNGLFPPRALFKTTTEANQEGINDVANESNNDEHIADEGNDEIDEGAEDTVDPEYDGHNRRDKKAVFTPQSALKSPKRTKRQIDYGTRTLSRYRRPTQNQAATSQAAPRSSHDDVYYDEAEVPTQRPKTQNTRYTSRYRPTTNENHEYQQKSQPAAAAAINTNSRIRPSKTAAKPSRAQFTLRSGGEKEVSNSYTPTNSRSSNFRRTQNIGANTNGYVPQTSARRKTLPTSSSSTSRTNKSRLRTYGNSYQNDNRNGRGRTNTAPNSRGTTRGSTRSRGRITSDAIDYEYIPNFDGTITVTHHIPTEVTIPVVNGQNTDYKNVITDKISTEILGPQQYSTTSRAYNGLTLVLTSEATNIVKGATEVTQFFLKETPTSSVTFTPTQINRRKTSYSHIVPSTVYNVEPVVSTMQPQISADAPLANILLSQLLLGNLGGALPQQQQLLGLGGQLPFNPIQTTQLAPVTDYKTRSTTYVTTLSNAEPTILTVTFRGKEILTTIYDDNVNVITATEFITDTIVSTPTQQQVQPTQNINNLLLQQLLAQQQQQPSLLQSHQQSPLNILMNIGANVDMDKSQSLLQDSLLTLGKETPHDSFNDNKNSKKLDIDEPLDDDIRNDYPDLESYENEPKTEKQRPPQPPSFLQNKPKKVAKPTPLETSIVTLYVSGRKPGEFSTVLSTVITTPDALLQKRAINEQVVVKASQLPDLNDVYNAEGSDIDEIYMPIAASTNDLNFIESSQNGIEYGAPAETQSLESILGDVSNYVTKSFLL
ncbi:uncharacterized protein LOC116340210 isoform X3 [Contarinia nasturtii]|uniref:uncharacterized protein LOC116340210 isoform X3 n=1 Tax=Contarinia nasturtii TaxID=265458 RepID=UPI0012D399D4|nr:uncharacterized protein LOC116340210 isoform X3 [Contarinia nasturtii]XP_031622420.1 uncharacterized protein LOC116340210 isoform X3 [Contarinia nasturtii]